MVGTGVDKRAVCHSGGFTLEYWKLQASQRTIKGFVRAGELDDALNKLIDGAGERVLPHQGYGIEQSRELIEVMGGNNNGASMLFA